ncbi:MAG TPA: phosphatidylglycerophosphatase A [Thermoanaerobaculia bacterium]
MSNARRAFAANPVAALLATGFGSGLSPIMPGTAGSVVGLVIGWFGARALALHAGSIGVSVGLLTSGLLIGLAGVVASEPVCRALGEKDPGCVVIDEIAGQLIASAAVPLLAPHPSPPVAAGSWIASFVLFRFYDIAKPGPIHGLQKLPGGWGVVVDDVAGGIAAAATLLAAGWLATRLGWI